MKKNTIGPNHKNEKDYCSVDREFLGQIKFEMTTLFPIAYVNTSRRQTMIFPQFICRSAWVYAEFETAVSSQNVFEVFKKLNIKKIWLFFCYCKVSHPYI